MKHDPSSFSAFEITVIILIIAFVAVGITTEQLRSIICDASTRYAIPCAVGVIMIATLAGWSLMRTAIALTAIAATWYALWLMLAVN